MCYSCIMKVLVFINKNKDVAEKKINRLTKALSDNKINYDLIFSDNEIPSKDYSAIFIIGGDGTILRRTEFANTNDIPIIGINAGKVGFLNEFEQEEIEQAVELFRSKQLVNDNRATMQVKYGGNTYYALNDVVVQRLYTENNEGIIINVGVSIDGNEVCKVKGDGVIVATPTGSTAYSLSAGGAILAPKINAFIFTPLASHSFSQRPVVFSSESNCDLTFISGCSAGLFIDGVFISEIQQNQTVTIKKSKKDTVFLRKKDSNFFSRLNIKLKDKDV